MKSQLFKSIAFTAAGLLMISAIVPVFANGDPSETKTTEYFFDDVNDDKALYQNIPDLSNWKPELDLIIFPDASWVGEYCIYKLYKDDYRYRPILETYRLVHIDKVYDVPGPFGIGTERRVTWTEISTNVVRDTFASKGRFYEIPAYLE